MCFCLVSMVRMIIEPLGNRCVCWSRANPSVAGKFGQLTGLDVSSGFYSPDTMVQMQ